MVLGTMKQILQRPLLRRAGWLLVAAAHAPGLVHVWRNFVVSGFAPEHVLGCLWLTLTVAFLALKVRDAAFLRFRTDLRSCLALGVVVALLHVDVIRPGSDPSVVPECTAVLASACAVGALPQARRWLKQVVRKTTTTRAGRKPEAASIDTAWRSAFRPHCWVLALGLFHLRAPPA